MTVLLHNPVYTKYFGSPLLFIGPYDTSLVVVPSARTDWSVDAGQAI